jgi:chromosome segregation ATPase
MDLERTMQYIVEQQAQFWASVQKHDEQMGELRASAAKNDQQIATLTDLVGRLAQAEIRLVEQVRAHEARAAEQMQDHDARLSSLETKTTQFFERMDRFIQGLEGNGHKPQ